MISWCCVEPCASNLSLENTSCVCLCVFSTLWFRLLCHSWKAPDSAVSLRSSTILLQRQKPSHLGSFMCPFSVLKHQLSLMSDHLTPVCQSITYLIRSHWHSAHSHGVHAHLALHLAMSRSWHLAHLSWSGPADWPWSTNGVVHHHGSKLALITLLRKLLLGVRARKQKNRRSCDISHSTCITTLKLLSNLNRKGTLWVFFHSYPDQTVCIHI